MWKLFLDDERYPVDDSFVIARSVTEAQKLISELGCPTVIYFDNDLGEGLPEGYHLAKWLCEQEMDGLLSIPDDFSWHVHSQNSQAPANISSYLTNYLTKGRTFHGS